MKEILDQVQDDDRDPTETQPMKEVQDQVQDDDRDPTASHL